MSWKRLVLLLILSGLMSCESSLQIPLKVSKNFWYKYENAVESEWTLADDVYTVTFTVNEFPKTATYRSDGEWIKTISPLPPKRSMICVRDFVDNAYPQSSINRVVFIETPTSEKYYITITVATEPGESTAENPDSFTRVILEFDSDCEFIGEQL